MSAAAALHSDHLNFLIYRYLQEFGHEKTARAFYRDWHRPVEHDDPESFPFAQAVQRNDLVSVIQDGLHHDELLARVRKCERRFRWTNIEARESVERQDGLIENGPGSRPPSRNKRKTRIAQHLRVTDDYLSSASKRQRRSEGSEAQVNGDRDAMDVDAASASADADEDNDAASPTAVSEPENAEAMVRYDSMEVGTQTDAVKTSTIYWKIDKPGVHISQCAWNPSTDTKNARTLLAVGETLCRFYQIPDSIAGDAQQITHVDEPSLPPDSVVTATAWRSDGSAASCAIDGIRALPDGSNLSSQTLVEYGRDSGSLLFQPGPPLLEPPGIVLHLRYSPNGQYLLLARTNLKRGSVQIWRAPRVTAGDIPAPAEPIAWCVFEQPVHDACWIAEDVFLVGGVHGLSSLYHVVDGNDGDKMDGVISTDSAQSSHGIVERKSKLLDETDECDKVRFDQRHKIAIFASTKSKRLFATSRFNEVDQKPEANCVIDLPGPPTDLAFQPLQKLDDEPTTLDDTLRASHLAVAFEDGICIIYGILRSPETGIKCNELASLNLRDGPALTLSWSPNGQHLALSSTDLVQIWHADSLRWKNGVLHTAEALITWRRPAEPKSLPNGTHTDASPDGVYSEPSLSWSADGESLAFAVDRQIAVIRFQPPLNARHTTNAEPNGILSP